MRFTPSAFDMFRSFDRNCSQAVDADDAAQTVFRISQDDSKSLMSSMIESGAFVLVEMLSKKIGITVEAVTARAKFPLEQGE